MHYIAEHHDLIFKVTLVILAIISSFIQVIKMPNSNSTNVYAAIGVTSSGSAVVAANAQPVTEQAMQLAEIVTIFGGLAGVVGSTVAVLSYITGKKNKKIEYDIKLKEIEIKKEQQRIDAQEKENQRLQLEVLIKNSAK